MQIRQWIKVGALSGALVAGLVPGALPPGMALAQSQDAAKAKTAPRPAGELVVSGSGQVASVPDMAVLRLGVTAAAASPGEAVEAMSARMEKVLEGLAEAGIERRDVQSSQLSLRPRYSDRRDPGRSPEEGPEIIGYEAVSDVTVRMRDLSRLGGVLDDVVSLGANRFDGLSFALQDPAEALDEARRLAVKDAVHKAEVLAEAAGVRLGPIRKLSESQDFGGGPFPMMAEARLAKDVPVAEGEVETSAQVTIVFALKR